ncbi:MAG: LysM peptidoglycan-binding domain-containing protein [Akkermansia sp.]|nr:LysM peptidoglycan-binding domain-containing protein [Akkermansia sp.]
MKLTSLILSVAGFCSLLSAVFAADNYSLWPRRPAELEQARHLVREQKVMEAAALLEPFVTETGIAGREARQILGAVNVRRYLSRRHPQAKVYKVQRGDTIERIADANKCPTDVLMLLNGLVEPSMLKRGQKLVVVPMNLRIEVRPAQREVSVWDGSQLVADYDIVEHSGLDGKTNEVTKVVAREGYLRGVAIPRRSLMYAASDRVLKLESDISITGAQRVSGAFVKMAPKDANELALLVGVGARVALVRDDAAYLNSLSAEAAPPAQK